MAKKKLPGPEQPIITWKAPEYYTFKKDPGWYTTIAAASLILFLFFLFVLDRWLPAIVSILGAIVLFVHANREPRVITYTILENGIKISRSFYPYESLKSFWMSVSEAGVAIYIETTNRLQPNIILQIGGENPEEIRIALARHLPEKPSGREELVDRVARFLKF